MPTPSVKIPLQQSVRLSAAALSTFDRCARQFRYLYLDQLSLPANTLEQERGRQFHRLVELHAQGQPVADRLLGVNPQVQSWWQTFESSPHWDPQGEIRSELPLWASIESWRIVARLDRLVLPHPKSRDPIEIIDWKTDRQRPSNADLAHNWQARLYPLLVWLLGEQIIGMPISPEQLRLTFWYVNDPQDPFVLQYSLAQAHSDLDNLHQALQTLEQSAQQHFPMTTEPATCDRCPFQTLCFGLMPHLEPEDSHNDAEQEDNGLPLLTSDPWL